MRLCGRPRGPATSQHEHVEHTHAPETDHRRRWRLVRVLRRHAHKVHVEPVTRCCGSDALCARPRVNVHTAASLIHLSLVPPPCSRAATLLSCRHPARTRRLGGLRVSHTPHARLLARRFRSCTRQMALHAGAVVLTWGTAAARGPRAHLSCNRQHVVMPPLRMRKGLSIHVA